MVNTIGMTEELKKELAFTEEEKQELPVVRRASFAVEGKHRP